MPKRPQSQLTDPENAPDRKRHNNGQNVGTEPQALDLLLSHADRLVETLRSLQAARASSSGSSQDQIMHSLRSISREVLPSVQFLAGGSQGNGNGNGNRRERQVRRLSSFTRIIVDMDQEPGLSSLKVASKPVPDKPSSLETCPAVPSPMFLSPFTLGDIPRPEDIPPLPEVFNLALRQAALTHTGVERNPRCNYERLEWLGDAYTEVISSSLLFQTFPNLDAGRLSQLRELLIKNTTLGKFAARYGLMTRVKLPASISQSTEKTKKVPGDLLEAHVAAVILSDPQDGLQRTGEWLRAIFSTVIKDQIKRNANEAKARQATVTQQGAGNLSNEPPKVQLAALVGASGVNLRYEDDDKAPKKDKYNEKLTVFTVNLFMDGWGQKNMWIGRGTDLNKKQAGQKAAQMALDNKGFIKSYGAKKKAWKAAREEGDVGSNENA